MKYVLKLAAASLVLLATVSQASAWTADRAFEQNVVRWYNNVPAQLRAIIERPKVSVYILESVNALKPATIEYFGNAKFAKNVGNWEAMALVVPNKPPAIYFVQPLMLNESDEESQRTVAHEMTHVYDFLAGRSKNSAYMAAYNADIQAGRDFLKTASVADRQLISKHYSYYAAQPKETYAEAGARLMFHPTSKNEWNNFYFLFPRATMYVCRELLNSRVVSNCNLSYDK